MESNRNCFLTTVDNPYDPFTQFDEWYAYDVFHGYNCCGLMDYFANTSKVFTEQDNNESIERAIDRVVEIDPLKQYVKVYEVNKKDKNSEENEEPSSD